MSDKPIILIFEKDMILKRIAEFIDILSELYGEDLDICLIKDLQVEEFKNEHGK